MSKKNDEKIRIEHTSKRLALLAISFGALDMAVFQIEQDQNVPRQAQLKRRQEPSA